MESTLTPAKLLAAQANASAGIAREDFDGIVRAHQRRIYRVLLGIVRDPDGDLAFFNGSDNRGYFLRVGEKLYDGQIVRNVHSLDRADRRARRGRGAATRSGRRTDAAPALR